jgi:uncharacterized protein (TIGR03118 family)
MPLQREKYRLQARRWACLLVGALMAACDGDGGGSFIATPTPTLGPLPTPTPTPSAYAVSALVSDGSVPAVTIDHDLINPWGVVFAPDSPVWVANNATGTATLYDGAGLKEPLVVALPGGINGPADPTGIVSNGTTDFVVSNGTSSAAATFISDGEGGTLIGWAPAVNQTNGIIAYDDGSGGAVYKGLAIAADHGANFLYATDFHNNKIDVFDKDFRRVASAGRFSDPSLPAGFAPFGIQAVAIGGEPLLFVTYAQRTSGSNGNVNGAGLGLVNVFDTSGTLRTHFVPMGGNLNAPWGIALAPATFGSLSNTVLIGNFGDGLINAYDPATGAFVDSIRDSAGQPIATPGLWGIAFGNGAHDQPVTTLYFAAGIANEAGGLYGRIVLAAGGGFSATPGTSPTDTLPPTVSLEIPGPHAIASGIITVLATVTDNVGVVSVEFFAGATSIGIARSPPFFIDWNSITVANGSVTLAARAKDAAGNVTTSAPVIITVSNLPRRP